MITIFRSPPPCVRRQRSYADPRARGTYLIYLRIHPYTSYPPTSPTVCVTLYTLRVTLEHNTVCYVLEEDIQRVYTRYWSERGGDRIRSEQYCYNL